MDTPQVLLDHHLKTLRLPTFLREYDKVAQQCAAEGVDFPRYLLRLSELELLDRGACRSPGLICDSGSAAQLHLLDDIKFVIRDSHDKIRDRTPGNRLQFTSNRSPGSARYRGSGEPASTI